MVIVLNRRGQLVQSLQSVAGLVSTLAWDLGRKLGLRFLLT